MMRVLLILLCSGAVVFGDLVIPAGSRGTSFDLGHLEPGETVFIEGGNRRVLVFSNILGSPEAPIVITNLNGPVVVNNREGDGGIVFLNCRNFILKGEREVPSGEYGIQVQGTLTGSGIDLRGGSSDFEITEVEISGTGFAGIIAKSDEFARNEWIMENVSIHDCYIHDVGGEGIYVGSSFFNTRDVHEIHGLRIYANRILRAGWDGIQVGAATRDALIFDNRIEDYGFLTEDPAQNEGMRLNPGFAGKVFNNFILGGSGTGIFANPYSTAWFFNNLIVGAGESGIMIGDDAGMLEGTSLYLLNNTIVDAGGDGIQFRSLTSRQNLAMNNLVVNVNGVFFNRRYTGVSVSESSNLYSETLAEAGVQLNPNGDYILLSHSSAVDAGTSVADFGISVDLLGNPRRSGPATDIGAIERPSDVERWGEWTVDGDTGWVMTGEGFLGWVNVSFSPFIWSSSLQGWCWLPQSHLGPEGAWTFVYR